MTTLRQPDQGRIWLERITLTDFRNYHAATLSLGPGPVVLFGTNGAGKTNCIEAISLLTAGRGMRGAAFGELARLGGSGGWAVAAQVRLGPKSTYIGTGIQPPDEGGRAARLSREVRIDEIAAKGSGALAATRMLWLAPAMDGLFAGAASERRRFLDRFVLSLDPAYARVASAYDRAMRQRNKALETFATARVLDAIEAQMAAAGVAVAGARRTALAALREEIALDRDREPRAMFPWAELELKGDLETQLINATSPGEVEGWFIRRLAVMRERDQAAGRALSGPHRSDLEVTHGPKAAPAKLCSTGEQKGLLVALLLAEAKVTKRRNDGIAPLLLFDEIAAHLDRERRAALFARVLELQAQVFMTGTDAEVFAPLREGAAAQFFLVSNGSFVASGTAESPSRH